MSGPRLLRHDGTVVCTHELGRVQLAPSQNWCTIEGEAVLVDDDPERRPIKRCPNATVSTKPCTATLAVTAGYSDLVRVDGRAVCLETVTGRTDGTGEVYRYKVNDPGQGLVRAES